jgi:hypothetical protein
MSELVIRLKSNPSFMSWVLATYQKQEHVSETNVIDILNTTPEMFYRLALCKRPDSNRPEFIDEIRQLANYTSIDPAHLANLIRQVEALETFKTMPNQLETKAETQTYLTSTGVLSAARDRDEKHEPAPPPDKASEDSNESQANNET